MKWIDRPSATEMVKDQVPLKCTKFINTFGTGTRIGYSISSISVALGLLSLSVALGLSIHFIGTSSTIGFLSKGYKLNNPLSKTCKPF